MHYIALLFAFGYVYMIVYSTPFVVLALLARRFVQPVDLLFGALVFVGLAVSGHRAKLAVDAYFTDRAGLVSAHMKSGVELKRQAGLLLLYVRGFAARWRR